MRKISYITVDSMSAISSYGEEFVVGEVVRHQDVEAGTATIKNFTLDRDLVLGIDEVVVITDKGYAHLDFIVKIK